MPSIVDNKYCYKYNKFKENSNGHKVTHESEIATLNKNQLSVNNLNITL